MSLFRWTIVWTIVSIIFTGVLSYLLFDAGLAVWKTNLRVGAGIFFAVSLLVGGVLTTDSNYKAKKRSYYQEEWSFICILVTISLFGISFIFS